MAVITGGNLRGLGSRSSFARGRLAQKSTAGLSDAQRVANKASLDKCIAGFDEKACRELQSAWQLPACEARFAALPENEGNKAVSILLGCDAAQQACSLRRKGDATASCDDLKSQCAPFKNLLIKSCPEAFPGGIAADDLPDWPEPNGVSKRKQKPKAKTDDTNGLLIIAGVGLALYFLTKTRR